MSACQALILPAMLVGTISTAMAAQQAKQDPVTPVVLVPDWTRAIEANLAAAEYHFKGSGDSCFAAPNRAEHLRTRVTADLPSARGSATSSSAAPGLDPGQTNRRAFPHLAAVVPGASYRAD